MSVLIMALSREAVEKRNN